MRSNRRPAGLADDLALNPMFTQDVEQGPVPRDRFPRRGMLPDTAYQLIHDELLLDGNSRQNVATFGTTWMEAQAQALMAETVDKNMIDKDDYPQTAEPETRCVRMLADLWHAPSVGVPRRLHGWFVGGVHARRPRPEAPLAGAPAGRRTAG